MGKYRSHWLLVPIVRLTSSFRRWPLLRRCVIVAAVCALYLGFVVSQVGYTQQHGGRRTDTDRYRQTRGLDHLGNINAPSDSADPQTDTNLAVPTRSNVVYITLRSQRLKPANIRGTVRPKLRRKLRRDKSSKPAVSEWDTDQAKRKFAPTRSRAEPGAVDYKTMNIDTQGEADPRVSSIRIYSQRAPPWFSAQDVDDMRFLADAKVLRVRRVSRGELPSLIIFEGETRGSPVTHGRAGGGGVCGGQCGVVKGPVDTAEVFAFHLDRVLGLNRTLPAVSRRFGFLHDAQPCPVVSWDASLFPEGLAAGPASVALTWGGYQRSLKQRCWSKNSVPKSDSGCSTVHHYEWSKLVLFDFLLQIHSRLDQSCCGFRPRQVDVCVGPGRQTPCGDKERIQLANIVHRGHDPRRLVFTDNKGFFDRNEDNLDFRLLEGIKELPEPAVSVLRSRRLRERLLQSLFLDQTYWESQGGRQGIDKLIDVIERRAHVLLTYVNAHGIRVVTMDA
ncbi:Golgi-associated kinase 1B [Betta splendens]|uniref:Golgi-associated kinase 1B n=1 Tax=Betta splendens TaxID=158456 RepID=A0A6P7NVX1_BETSP|nr:Golgi-associated kinase 1B [Betta splendens]